MRATLDLGGPVHVERFGSGPPMVLVHGLGSCHVHWRAVRGDLAQSHRLHIVDLPGFGLSPLAGRGADLESYARLLAHLLDDLGRPAVLVGNSMGALISLLATRLSPAAVGSLILVAPPAPRPVLTPLEPSLALLFSAYTLPVVGEVTRDLWIRINGPDRMVRKTFEACCSFPDEVPAEVVRAARKLASARSHSDEVHAFIRAYRSMWRYLLNGRRFDALLRSTQAPTLVIEGTADRLVPAQVTKRIELVRPDWSYVRLKGAGHMPQLDAPSAFVTAVTRWLAPLPYRRRKAS